MDVPVGVEFPRGNDTWHYGRKMVVMKKLAVGRVLERWALWVVAGGAVGVGVWWVAR